MFHIEKKYYIFFVVIFFLLVNFWHPFYLGYYTDDWNLIGNLRFVENISQTPFNFDILNHYINCFGNRPLTSIFWYIGYSLFNDSNIAGWQVYILIISLINLCSFRYFYLKFLIFLNLRTNSFLDEIPAILFIILPWNLAYNHWISLSMSAPAITFFYISMYFLIKNWMEKKSKYFFSAFFLFLTLITYESFYFQWAIFLIIAWMYRKKWEISNSSIFITLAIFSAIQFAAILWNRISIPLFPYIVNKASNPYLIQTFAANIISLPWAVISSFLIGSILLIPGIILLIFKSRKNCSIYLFSDKIIFKILSLFSLGTVISILLFSAVGYSVWGLGNRSRTLIMFSFYFILFLGIIINKIYLEKLHISKLLKINILLIILVFCAYSINNSIDWAKSFTIQKENINSVYSNKLNDIEKNDLILVNAPFRYCWISVFDAQWALNAQLNYGPYILNLNKNKFNIADTSNFKFFVLGKNIIHPVKNTPFVNYWDGKKLFQYYDEFDLNIQQSRYFYSRQLNFSGNNLWNYNLKSDKLTKVNAEQKIQFEAIKNYDYWLTELYSFIKQKK